MTAQRQQRRCVGALVAAAAVAGCAAFAPALPHTNALSARISTAAGAHAPGYGSSVGRRRLRVLNEPLPQAAGAADREGATVPPEQELQMEVRSRHLQVTAEVTVPSEAAPAAAVQQPTQHQQRKAPLRASKEAKLVIEGDTLEDKPYMVALLATTLTVAAVMFGGAVAGVAASEAPLLSAAGGVAAAAAGVLFADAFTGVFHWSVDNYGNLQTPVLGSVIEAFQGHHGSPWTITYRNFANNVHKICYGVLPLLGLLQLSHLSPAGTIFGVFALMGLLMCQELHKWSHMVRPPAWVARLQDTGIILSKREHGLHHTSPYEEKYCIVTGHCNDFLDSTGFFRQLERIVYERTGTEPNCWKLDDSGKIKAAALGTAPQPRQ